MRTLIRSIFKAFVVVAIFFTACQTEQIIVNDPAGKTIDNMSPLADLVVQTTMNDGSVDNIIDNASCLTVALPVTVIANGTEILIETTDDYKLIERVFDEFPDDVDVLEIVFPIKVILADFSEQEIGSSEELMALAADCLEGGDDIDIECIDFLYPISLSLYNSDNQVTDIITFSSDEEFNEFMDDLDDNVVISFNFPITMVMGDSTEVMVNSNEELENLIEEVENTCDEDDDQDYNDDDIDDSELSGIMLSSDWVITNFENNEDHTSSFENMIFSFDEYEKAYVMTNDILIEGEWNTYGDDGELEVEMEFSEVYPLELLGSEDWQVLSYDSTYIELSYTDEDSISAYLTFEATELMIEPAPSIADFVVNGDWLVALYKDDGIDETSNYAGYSINFSTDFNLIFANDLASHEGDWEEVSDLEDHLFILDFGSDVESFKKLTEDWDVVSYTEDRIELEKYDSGTETTDNLVLEKIL